MDTEVRQYIGSSLKGSGPDCHCLYILGATPCNGDADSTSMPIFTLSELKRINCFTRVRGYTGCGVAPSILTVPWTRESQGVPRLTLSTHTYLTLSTD